MLGSHAWSAVHVLRDDLRSLHPPVQGPQQPGSRAFPVTTAGNKARKLQWLFQLPPCEWPRVILSHGGAQSNAMRALAGLVWQQRSARGDVEVATSAAVPHFVYVCPPLPAHLKGKPVGNFAAALALGTTIVETPSKRAYHEFTTAVEGVASRGGWAGSGTADCQGAHASWHQVLQAAGLHGRSRQWDRDRPGASGSVLLVPQGGATEHAQLGCFSLGQDVVRWWDARLPSSPGRRLVVALPAGTGTTAYFLHQYLRCRTDISVLCVAAVGNAEYTRQQMAKLQGCGATAASSLPVVLDPPRAGCTGKQRYRFGGTASDLLAVWQALEAAHLAPDLLYAPVAWAALAERARDLSAGDNELLYVHTGGAEGVPSQLERYRRAGLWEPESGDRVMCCRS